MMIGGLLLLSREKTAAARWTEL